MTEDEAFVRAVVDHPGDDTPRLVYADWLDDRADPRGTYFRAEAEWAKPWRDGQRPADSPELHDMAAGLDPVWVARVSRPPLGVCCDRARFDSPGPPLTDDDIARFEEDVGVPITGDYRAFLLNVNVGCRRPSGLGRQAGAGHVQISASTHLAPMTKCRPNAVYVITRASFAHSFLRSWLKSYGVPDQMVYLGMRMRSRSATPGVTSPCSTLSAASMPADSTYMTTLATGVRSGGLPALTGHLPCRSSSAA